ncbi:hypothetical protein NITGR_430014 [Nitrospina gracilis 3/211]|uniref:Serine protease n=1 Tax=Nitrospina gracilis (strain 3/211) TaxID=1266370 RepID=M1YYQ6_NITG3|nr:MULTISPECIES: hypothetical protein [Nitrospina]MCF8723747.1 hypothetical protein [Nitrospina sp. Nb-3]CCQ90847.1 hypothetical protein NITGR_430014 [Nitrospina gracilis 3/211]
MPSRKDLGEVKNRCKEEILRLPGVHGIAIGFKMKGNALLPTLCIQVYVRHKRPNAEIPREEQIPAEIDGVPTDVIASGPVETLLDDEDCPNINQDTNSYRPLRGGVQIQARGGGKGTLACVVRTRETPPRDVMLTNEHVLYSGTATGPSCSGCTAGSAVGQPTWSSSNKLGNILKGKTSALVDGAISSLDPGTQWQAEIEDIGVIAGTEHVTWEILEDRVMNGAGLYPVKKRGAKTRLSEGVITAVNFEGTSTDVWGTHRQRFEQQIMIFPVGYETGNVCFSARGDSGSAVVNEDNKIVGLLFGSNGITNTSTSVEYRAGVACPITNVLNELQVDLVFGQPAGHIFTVPEPVSESVALASEAVPSPAPASMTEEEHVLLRERVQNDIAQIEGGRAYLSLFKIHENEVRVLVNTNKKVAALWRKHGGPVLLHHLIRAAQFPGRSLPQAIGKQSWRESVHKISETFQKHGSERLRQDIDRARDLFASLGGRTYPQILERLETVLA